MKDKDEIIVRKAGAKDMDAIIRYNIMMAKETEDMDLDYETVVRGVKAVMEDPHRGFYLVAEKGEEIVGQLMVTDEWSDWRNKYFLWLQSVYVRKDHRNQKVFSRLYHYLMDITKSRHDVAGFRLYVEKNNHLAKKVYEALGMSKSIYDIYEAPCDR